MDGKDENWSLQDLKGEKMGFFSFFSKHITDLHNIMVHIFLSYDMQQDSCFNTKFDSIILYFPT